MTYSKGHLKEMGQEVQDLVNQLAKVDQGESYDSLESMNVGSSRVVQVRMLDINTMNEPGDWVSLSPLEICVEVPEGYEGWNPRVQRLADFYYMEVCPRVASWNGKLDKAVSFSFFNKDGKVQYVSSRADYWEDFEYVNSPRFRLGHSDNYNPVVEVSMEFRWEEGLIHHKLEPSVLGCIFQAEDWPWQLDEPLCKNLGLEAGSDQVQFKSKDYPMFDEHHGYGWQGMEDAEMFVYKLLHTYHTRKEIGKRIQEEGLADDPYQESNHFPDATTFCRTSVHSEKERLKFDEGRGAF